MVKPTINVEKCFNSWFAGKTVEELKVVKEGANKYIIKQGITPGKISKVFNAMIDSHIESEQAQDFKGGGVIVKAAP